MPASPFVTIGVLLFFNWWLSHLWLKHFRYTWFLFFFFTFITELLYLTVLLQLTVNNSLLTACQRCLIAHCWNTSMCEKCLYLGDIPVQQPLMHVIIIFPCWLVWIFHFFINHSYSYGAWAPLHDCNYTCWDTHSPLHLWHVNVKKKKKKENIAIPKDCITNVDNNVSVPHIRRMHFLHIVSQNNNDV